MTAEHRRLVAPLRVGLASLALALLAVGLVGCRASQDATPTQDTTPTQNAGATRDATPADGWTAVAESTLAPGQRQQVERARVARDALFGQLMGTLMPLLQDGDEAAAIEVCKDRAPAIAAEVSQQQGLRIGRTSWKLRNPSNAAPPWATPLLAERPDGPRFASGPHGALGVTFPIRVAEPCLRCHGPAESLAPTVRDALADLYPDDRATGFAAGDLRGWFWVEVPTRSTD